MIVRIKNRNVLWLEREICRRPGHPILRYQRAILFDDKKNAARLTEADAARLTEADVATRTE